jgi:hypothetical protein
VLYLLSRIKRDLGSSFWNPAGQFVSIVIVLHANSGCFAAFEAGETSSSVLGSTKLHFGSYVTAGDSMYDLS